MNGNDTYLDVNNAHLRVTSGNVHASGFNLDQISIVTTSNTGSTINFLNDTKGFMSRSNIEVGTANLFVDTTTSRVGIGTNAPAYTLDVHGSANVGAITSTDINVTGNLTVLGTSTIIDTDNLRVKDPIIELGKDNTASPIVDLGLILTRPTGNSNVAIIFDESTDKLEIGYTQGNASQASIAVETAAANPISVNVNGTISGNGSGLTALPAAQITGTLDVARIPALDTAKITTGTLDAARIPALDTAKITTGTLDAARIPTLNQNTTGSAATLTTPRSIGGVNFDGSAAIVPTTFGAATFSGDVTVDSTTFHVDSTDNRVGIGTTSPGAELHVSGTGAIVIPSGTTAQQPTGVTGMIRFNTAVGKLEFYNGAVWSMIGGVSGTGGTITNVNGYTIHTFTSSGTFTVISGGEVEYLIVAGGGGGSNTLYCGGGGAGGMLTGTLSSLSSGSYTITRGGGGATGTNGTVGSGSQFNTIIANGGGGGGGVNSNGVNGGSGGGGGYAGGSTEGNGRVGGTGVAGQGNNGGQGNGVNGYGWGGGGGGAGAAGTTARRPNSTQPGNGGNGVQSSITGTATYYAGGAGGRIDSGGYSASGGFGGGGSGGSGSNANGTAGGTNTGGGGGPSKAGGSGIVIIRYLS